MSTDTTPLLISAAELASLLGISERTLWRLLSAGRLPQPLRLGRNTRWRSDEIRRWIDSGCPDPGCPVAGR
ncbi:helix-turn-helix domain-containing protein [Paludisphaera sp.]|uniref:helix-turn-helix transcriptional regulator n=1 Tax=Paludisphaera sp. TaxID=2017432 RepID=UPI00301D38A7